MSTGDELASFTQKTAEAWDLQFTISESHAIRVVSQEIQVFSPADWSQGVVDKLKVEGVKSVALSPGLNPSLAVFVAEKSVCKYIYIAYTYLTVSSMLRANLRILGSTVSSTCLALLRVKRRHFAPSMPVSNGILLALKCWLLFVRMSMLPIKAIMARQGFSYSVQREILTVKSRCRKRVLFMTLHGAPIQRNLGLFVDVRYSLRLCSELPKTNGS